MSRAETGKAAKIVDLNISHDEKTIDLSDQLNKMPETIEEEIFEKKQFSVIPNPIFQQYSKLNYTCFMGLFPEIDRAWVSIDNRLYIWNYKNGGDFYEFDELNQVIISVSLVVPKPGIFKDYIKYLLVLSTSVEVVLVAVTFTDGIDEINLLETNYSISTDNVKMLKISGTSNGRIFLCGEDGCLYELSYVQEETWLRNKIRKYNHTQSMFGILIPSFLKFSSETPLIDIVVDHSRNILYTLSQTSSIDVYSLGSEGNSMTKVDSYSSLVSDAQSLLPRVHWDKETLKLVSISKIGKSESRSLQLVCVSSKGDRFYFSTCYNDSPDSVTLKFIKRAHQLKSHSKMSLSTSTGITDIHESFYQKGVFLMSDSVSDDTDQLIALTVEPTSKIYNQRTFGFSIYETTTLLQVKGKTLAIAEVPLSISSNLLPKHKLLDELVTQHLKPKREFVCLSNNGIHILSKLRPIDELKNLLKHYNAKDPKDKNVLKFVEKHGADEVCSMCLTICCSRQLLSDDKNDYDTNSFLTKNAESLFFSIGGEPFIDDRILDNQPGYLVTQMGKPIAQNIIFSKSHNGLFIYFARLVRPLWKYPIVSFKDSVVNCRYTPNELKILEHPLANLHQFFIEHKNLYSAGPKGFNDRQGNIQNVFGDVEEEKLRKNNINKIEALKNEQLSLSGLFELNKRCLQAISFIEILNANDLYSLLKQIKPDKIEKVSQIIFRDLILVEGEDIMKDLVKLIIVKGSSTPIETLVKKLKEKCYSFFNSNDLNEYFAFDLLQKAKSSQDPATRQESISESLKIYLTIAGNINVPVTVREFQRLHAFTAAVSLALAAPEKVDPSGLAFEWMKNGSQPRDEEGKQAYFKREISYKCALDVLEQLYTPIPVKVTSTKSTTNKITLEELTKEDYQRDRLKVLNIMQNSKDELFHDALYEWFISKGMENDLLRMQTPFLESFLFNKKKRLDLLAKYYIKNEKFEKGAVFLLKIAESDADIDLSKRVDYLSQALGNAKAAAGKEKLALEIKEKLEVARVQQKVLKELISLNNEKKIDSLSESIKDLNSSLRGVTYLYNNFAKKFQLDSRISIVHCSDYADKKIIIDYWKKAIEKHKNMGITSLTNFFEDIAPEIYKSEPSLSQKFFPLNLICQILEFYSCEAQNDVDWVFDFLRRTVRVSYLDLFRTYQNLFEHNFGYGSSSEEFFDPEYEIAKKDKIRIFKAISILVYEWIEYISSQNASISEKKEFPIDDIHKILTTFESQVGRLHDNSDTNFIRDYLKKSKFLVADE